MRLWQGSIRTTIALTVVIAMVLGVSVQQLVHNGLPHLGLLHHQPPQRGGARLLRQLPGRVAVLLEILDAVPDSERAAILAVVQRPQLHVKLIDAPVANLTNHVKPDADLLRRRIQSVMLTSKPVIVADRYEHVEPKDASGARAVESGMLIEAALSDGRWLLFESKLDPPPAVDPVTTRYSRVSFAAWLALSIGLAILLATLAARRLVKPLSELSSAAEQLGGSGDAAPIVPRGPREVQSTIQAFNRMQERLRRFNEDRTRMIAAMSHDLKTPLTRLQLRLEMIEDQDQQQRMVAELDTMNAMIESILAFARDDAKREPRTLVDLSALLEGIGEDAADAGEPVTYSGPRGVTVYCRPTGLRRAISNLVENAVKYGNSATLTLIPEADRVVITVEDEGPGIPRDERDKVFQPFYRVEGSRNPVTGGVGLGLSVARSIIWEHGGDIRLGNRRGGGLTVRVELPIGAGLIPSSETGETAAGEQREGPESDSADA